MCVNLSRGTGLFCLQRFRFPNDQSVKMQSEWAIKVRSHWRENSVMYAIRIGRKKVWRWTRTRGELNLLSIHSRILLLLRHGLGEDEEGGEEEEGQRSSTTSRSRLSSSCAEAEEMTTHLPYFNPSVVIWGRHTLTPPQPTTAPHFRSQALESPWAWSSSWLNPYKVDVPKSKHHSSNVDANIWGLCGYLWI